MGTARTPRRCQDYADSLIQLLRSGIESKGSSGGDDAPSVWTLQRIAWQKVKSRQISSNFTNHDVRDTRSKWHLASVVARVRVNVHFIRIIYTAMALAAGAHRLTRPLWHRQITASGMRDARRTAAATRQRHGPRAPACAPWLSAVSGTRKVRVVTRPKAMGALECGSGMLMTNFRT